MKIIVHADDFGLSKQINEGIIYAHTNGILTSTSIMACGPAFDHAVQLIKEVGSLDIGVHLTVIEERPLLSPLYIPSLVANGERFHPHAKDFFKRYIMGRISLEEVRLEFTKQIEKVLDNGIDISHIDSHQHIHILPGIFKITVALARKYGIRSIRFPDEKLRLYMFKRISGYPRVLQLVIVKTILKFANKKNNLFSPKFYGFFFGGRLNRENLRIILKKLPKDGIAEIMCHPGLSDPDSNYLHWKYDWQDELDALTDNEIRNQLIQRGIKLYSFRDL